MVYICAAQWKVESDSQPIYGFAVVKDRDNVLYFINPDGSAHHGDIWNYRLDPHRGAMPIPIPQE